ncbi:nudC domain-containing protein 2 isoform X1 [Crocuta crocuta]
MSAPFEERSGVVPCGTPWGQWYQTLEEVFIEVQVPPGTRAQDIQCGLQSRHVALAVGGREILKGKLFDSTIADEGTWTLEDRKMVRIVLTKTKRDAANCWTSLLESEYAADPWVQDQMQRKLTLERFQKENPGFDFSGAEISGNYSKALALLKMTRLQHPSPSRDVFICLHLNISHCGPVQPIHTLCQNVCLVHFTQLL